MKSAPEKEMNNAAKHYEEWKNSFPRLSAEMTKKALRDKSRKISK